MIILRLLRRLLGKILDGIAWLTQDSPKLYGTKIQGSINRVKYAGRNWDEERAEDPEARFDPDDGSTKYT